MSLSGDSIFHCSIDCHLDRHQLAFLLALEQPAVRPLGWSLSNNMVYNLDQLPRHSHTDSHSQPAYLTLRVTLRRGLQLADAELERLEAIFSAMPAIFIDWAGDKGMQPACKPRWQLCAPGSEAIQMCWQLPIEKLVEEQEEEGPNPSPTSFFALDLSFDC